MVPYTHSTIAEVLQTAVFFELPIALATMSFDRQRRASSLGVSF
jgi:hypothetical protein